MLAALRVLALAVAAQGQTPPVSTVPAIDEAPTKAGSYNWMQRHQEKVDRIKQGKVGLLFIGDSITHGWEGGGRDVWDRYYAPRNAVNLGFGWDRTEHVLWRLEHGEIDGIAPKVAVILIGVNNLGANQSVEVAAAGVKAVVEEVHRKLPRTKILLLGTFPWKEMPNDPQRLRVNALNARSAALDGHDDVTYLNIGDAFLRLDGSMSRLIMPDYLHPNHRGYQIWAREMEPVLAKLMGDKPIVDVP